MISCVFILHLLFGIMLIVCGDSYPDKSEGPPGLYGLFLAGISGVIVFFGLITAYLNVVTARSIKRRQARLFCLAIAGIDCLSIPFGTILGVMTFIVLGRNSVKAMFLPNQTLETSVTSSPKAQS